MSSASSGRRKVTVIGAGMVGGTVAQMLAIRDYADVILVDIVEGMPQGKSLDLMQMGTLLGFDTQLTGANSYEETAGSDVIWRSRPFPPSFRRMPNGAQDSSARHGSWLRSTIRTSPQFIAWKTPMVCPTFCSSWRKAKRWPHGSAELRWNWLRRSLSAGRSPPQSRPLTSAVSFTGT